MACMVVHALRGAKAALSGETGQVSKAALMALRDAILEEDPECLELLEALAGGGSRRRKRGMRSYTGGGAPPSADSSWFVPSCTVCASEEMDLDTRPPLLTSQNSRRPLDLSPGNALLRNLFSPTNSEVGARLRLSTTSMTKATSVVISADGEDDAGDTRANLDNADLAYLLRVKLTRCDAQGGKRGRTSHL